MYFLSNVTNSLSGLHYILFVSVQKSSKYCNKECNERTSEQISTLGKRTLNRLTNPIYEPFVHIFSVL